MLVFRNKYLEVIWKSGKTILIYLSSHGRMDNPGVSAKYCTYLGIDEQTEEIVAMEIVDKREVDLKSTSMEKEGFIRSMKSLENANIRAKKVATDAHAQITKLVSKLDTRTYICVCVCVFFLSEYLFRDVIY